MLRPMQPQALTFDTHAFVKRLTQAGMPEDQAEVLANGQADLYERLVTKEHLEQKLGALELTLRNELEKVKAELKHDIDKVQANLEITRTELKRDIKDMEQKLTIKLGALLVIGVTVMTLIDKLFQAPCAPGHSRKRAWPQIGYSCKRHQRNPLDPPARPFDVWNRPPRW